MDERKFILAGWLIDGSGGPAQKNVLLCVEDGRIVSLEQDAELASLTGVTDLSHCTILPPLVDSHVHLFMSGTTARETREKQLTASYEELRPVIRRHLHYLYSHGVLGVRDGGDFGGYALRYMSEEKTPAEMQIRLAGKAWRRENRYGSLIGRAPDGDRSLEEAFLEYDDEENTDHVKVVNSGLNSLCVFGQQTQPQFTVKELRSLIQAANRRGKKVMAHANGELPVRLALEAGCQSIEHGFFMGRANLEMMAKRGVVWVPTLYTMKAYAINAEDTRSQIDLSVAWKNLEHQLGQLRLARELGVTVALGTDSGSLGVLHGEAVVEEMKLFKIAGYTLPEIIRCATMNGARLLNIEEFGLLAPKNRASFLVTRGAPSQLPRKLSYLESLYIDGKPSELYHKNPVKHIK